MPFLLHDIAHILAATAAMPFLLFFPGYALAILSGTSKFFDTATVKNWLYPVALSFATVPILIYLSARCGSLTCALILILALDSIALWHIFRVRNLSIQPRVLALIAIWTLFVLFETIDIPFHGHLYVSGMVLDHSYRVAFLQSIIQHGIPPQNPLYFPTSPQPLRYYYFWYALCALPARYLHLDPRAVLISSCIAAGVGLASVVLLYLRSFFPTIKTRIALALLAVTGLDILVIVANTATGIPLDIDPEWWSRDQVASWIDTVHWVPHHTAALIAALTAIFLLWKSRGEASTRQHWPTAILVALSIASALGLSTYIGITLILLLCAWTIRLLLRKELPAALQSFVALAVAAILALPHFFELRARTGTGHAPLSLGIRQMVQVDISNTLANTLLHLALLPVGYFVEFGVFAIGFLVLFKTKKNERTRTLLFFAITSLVITTFIRSTAIQNNDFGYRSILFTQFFLLLLTAQLLTQWQQQTPPNKTRNRLIATMLVIGVASSVYQVVILRTFALRSPHNAEIAHDLRTGYDKLQSIASPDSVVQWEPSPDLTADLQNERILHSLHLLYARHQTAATDSDCGAPFGGDPSSCETLQRDLQSIAHGASAAEAQTICSRWGIDYLVATESEPAWTSHNAWPWLLPSVIELPHMRVVTCGQTNLH